jgi:hypothetical protein
MRGWAFGGVSFNIVFEGGNMATGRDALIAVCGIDA